MGTCADHLSHDLKKDLTHLVYIVIHTSQSEQRNDSSSSSSLPK